MDILPRFSIFHSYLDVENTTITWNQWVWDAYVTRPAGRGWMLYTPEIDGYTRDTRNGSSKSWRTSVTLRQQLETHLTDNKHIQAFRASQTPLTPFFTDAISPSRSGVPKSQSESPVYMNNQDSSKELERQCISRSRFLFMMTPRMVPDLGATPSRLCLRRRKVTNDIL